MGTAAGRQSPAAMILWLSASSLMLCMASAQFENFKHSIRDAEECASVNTVLPRGDDFTSAAGNFTAGQLSRPWSIHQDTYSKYLQLLPYCNGVRQLLASLQHGGRSHGRSVAADVEIEASPTSIFSPHACSYRWYTPSDMCQIFSGFSHVRLVGDSLMRHLNQALFMLLRGDYEYGGIPLQMGNLEVFEKCRCDSQFSEHGMCRFGSSMSFLDHRQYGLCLGGPVQPFALTNAYSTECHLGWDASMCPKDSRPVMILAGGGAHHQSDANATIAHLIDPLMEAVKQAALSCPHAKLHVAWFGLGTQSRGLDVAYPHQKRENIAAFNSRVSHYLQSSYQVDFFDVWNLTKDAPSSDGYHYLSDVNIVKAMYVANYLDMLSEGQRTDD